MANAFKFNAIPEDGRRKAYAETLVKEKAEEEARTAAEKAQEAADAEKQKAQAANLAEEAEQKAQAAGASVENLLSRAKDISSGLSWGKFSSQIATAVQTTTGEKLKTQIATVRGQAKARSLTPQKAVVKSSGPKFPSLKAKEEPKPKPKPKPKPNPKAEKPQPKAEVRKVFGGLFQQETIYVDDE